MSPEEAVLGVGRDPDAPGGHCLLSLVVAVHPELETVKARALTSQRASQDAFWSVRGHQLETRLPDEEQAIGGLPIGSPDRAEELGPVELPHVVHTADVVVG